MFSLVTLGLGVYFGYKIDQEPAADFASKAKLYVATVVPQVTALIAKIRS